MTAETQTRPASSIYDLGYRTYGGERLGRRHATYSLFVYSLRAAFGIGRSMMNKVFPIGLAAIVFLPASAYLAVAALAPTDPDLPTAEDYFTFIQLVLGLFSAVVAPEIIGRDQRNRTLPLYFSRALNRNDYVTAKVAALFAAMFIVVLVPQLLLFVGNIMAKDDLVDEFLATVDTIPPLIVTSAAIALFLSGIGLSIASFTPNRTMGTGLVLGYGVIATFLTKALVEITGPDVRQFVVLLSPYDVLEGTVTWIFNATPRAETTIALAGQELWVYAVATAAYCAFTLSIVYRRFRRLVV